MTPIHIKMEQIITNGSMGADVTSSSINVNEISLFAIQFIWSSGSTPVGNAILQGSIDGSNYVDISTTAVSGNSGSVLFNVNGAGYSHVRVKYTRTSGSATANAYFNGKAS